MQDGSGAMDRWSEQKANNWWAKRPWVCGCNFLPSTAVNFIEMWHADTFDMPTIERELGWAAGIGFNAIRINLPFQGWQHDRDGLFDRLDRVMGVAGDLGIDTVPCLFDDCGFGGAEPVWGPQPAPVEGVHNSRAVASPGRAAVADTTLRKDLQAYVRDCIRTFRNDPRVLFWDLYNEPGNSMEFGPGGYGRSGDGQRKAALDLMEDCFAWARAENPVQPLTVAAWTTPPPDEDAHPYQTEIDRRAILQSDIVTFHAYWNRERVAQFIDYLSVLGRPVICTEWMARSVDSKIADQLQLFKDTRVGCFQWGLVRGRTQTWLPWPADLVRAHGGDPDRDIWFHDLLHEDGTPYDALEVETIRALTGSDGTSTRKATG
ncbi:MAG: cellulase family glycosylhydrolase [Rhodobacter sp.]|nr:cellulase family glycosylhydrolase [Rhodobacter sp.]